MKAAAQRRSHAERLEKIGRDARDLHFDWIRTPERRWIASIELSCCEAIEYGVVASPRHKIGSGQKLGGHDRHANAEEDQLLRRAVREWTQIHRIRHAEDDGR